MKKRPIIIDTDPGQDDAVALLLAFASPELEILGITAVAGNVPLEKTQKNARKLVELAERTEIPVFAGCDRPLEVPLETAEYVHGETGLNGSDLPDPVVPLANGHAVDFLIECLSKSEKKITLCPLGPLTNIASLLLRAPSLAAKVQEIVLMGGSWKEGGNVTAAAEFNLYVDPKAADIVFKSGIPITMMPLDVTHKAMVTRHRLRAFQQIGNKAGAAVAGMLDFFNRYDTEVVGMEGGPLHDPTTIAWLIAPDMFGGHYCHVEIEVNSPLTRGMSVVDERLRNNAKPNANVITSIDDHRFFDLLTERLARLP